MCESFASNAANLHSLDLEMPAIEVFNDDDRRLLLVALKVLYHNELKVSLALGYPVTKSEIERMVTRLGGRPELL